MQYNKYNIVIRSAAVLCMIVGMVVIIGWIFNIENFESIFHQYASMKFNTALCFLLSGCALLFFFNETNIFNTLQKIFSLLVILIGVISFAEDFFNIKTTAFDELFTTDIATRLSGIGIPGRMSCATAVCFGLVAFRLFFIRSRSSTLNQFMQWALQVVMLISMVAIMSYIYKVPPSNKLAFFNSMALHTALCFFCLSISLSLVNPSFGVTGLFTGDKIGNIMARRLFPALFFVILVTTFFRLEVNRQNMIGLEFAAILFSTFFY